MQDDDDELPDFVTVAPEEVEKAEVEGVCVSEAVDDRGRADLRRMGGWSAYCAAAVQIRERLMAADATDSMIA